MGFLFTILFLLALFLGRFEYEVTFANRELTFEMNKNEHGWLNFRRETWMNQYGSGFDLFFGPFRLAWSAKAVAK